MKLKNETIFCLVLGGLFLLLGILCVAFCPDRLEGTVVYKFSVITDFGESSFKLLIEVAPSQFYVTTVEFSTWNTIGIGEIYTATPWEFHYFEAGQILGFFIGITMLLIALLCELLE